MRPKPIPARPAALRAISAEDARCLRRRGPAIPPDADAVWAALDHALSVLRPHCYRREDLDGFAAAVAPTEDRLFGGQAARQAFVGILRQLGRAPE